MSCAKRKTQLLVSISLVFLVACQGEYVPTADELDGLNDPLPPFLRYVDPEPQEAVLLETFRTGAHHELRRNPEYKDAENSVCAEINPEPALEPGDFFELYSEKGEYFPDRISAYVDGSKLESREAMIVLGTLELRDERGIIVADAPGPYIMCWTAKIGIGEHIATLEVWKTSGDTLSYSWSFRVLEG